MFIEGLTDEQKKLLAVTLRDQGHMAFMVIKHAVAALQCAKLGKAIHSVDSDNLSILDDTIESLFGYQRLSDSLRYHDTSKLNIPLKSNDSH